MYSGALDSVVSAVVVEANVESELARSERSDASGRCFDY